MGWEWRLFYQGDLRAAFCDHVATRLPTMRRKGEDELRTDVYVRWGLCQQRMQGRVHARLLETIERVRTQPAATVQLSPSNTSPVTRCVRARIFASSCTHSTGVKARGSAVPGEGGEIEVKRRLKRKKRGAEFVRPPSARIIAHVRTCVRAHTHTRTDADHGILSSNFKWALCQSRGGHAHMLTHTRVQWTKLKVPAPDVNMETQPPQVKTCMHLSLSLSLARSLSHLSSTYTQTHR